MAAILRLYNSNTDLSINSNTYNSILCNYKMEIVKPTIFSLKNIGYGFIINLFWLIFSLGKFKILLLTKNNDVVHFSYITPKIYRFSFMNKNDIQIGPCFTTDSYRRKGIYESVLQYIIDNFSNPNSLIWIYTSEKNIASQSVIHKVGFKFYSLASISKFTRKIELIKKII